MPDLGNPLVQTVVIPVVVAFVLALVARLIVDRLRPGGISPDSIGAIALLVTLFLATGWPPAWPATSAQQKIPFIVGAAILIDWISPIRWRPTLAVLGAMAALAWLAQTMIERGGGFDLIPYALGILLMAGLASTADQRPEPGAAAIAFTAAAVAGLGAIGGSAVIAQAAGALAAGTFVAIIVKWGRGAAPPIAGTVAVAAIGGQAALFSEIRPEALGVAALIPVTAYLSSQGLPNVPAVLLAFILSVAAVATQFFLTMAPAATP